MRLNCSRISAILRRPAGHGEGERKQSWITKMPDDDLSDPNVLRARAARYRALARQMVDERALQALLELASKYDGVANKIEQRKIAVRGIERGRRR